ncbi:MAG: ABC transporter ATP-binding protein [Propionibacteriaceae bacterium]|nr:ABC transporter ATP-binding protein [Propionibacteriaceae bacterium]
MAEATGDALIEVRGLTVSYETDAAVVDAVSGIDLTLSAGECVALVGESGSGKSTVGRVLLGLGGASARVHAERLEIAGRDARSFGERQWRAVRGRYAGLVLQDALVSLDPLRTVAHEILESLRAADPLPRAGRRAEVEKLLTGVGIPDPEVRASQYAHQLSGGLRQRALIASAIAARPRVLIADEPTTALDVSVQRQVLELLKSLTGQGMGLLLISHDLAVVSEIADHVIVLRDGAIVEQGSPHQILARPAQAYTRQLVSAIPRIHARPGTEAEPPPTERSATVLEGHGLTVRYRRAGRTPTIALDSVDLIVQRGRTLGVVGESGSGKSTLLQVLLALQEPDDGIVLLDGEPWTGIPERDRRPLRPRLQIVAQDPLSAFDPRWDVRRILLEAARARGRDPRLQLDLCVRNLEDVGLGADLLRRHPLELSGGQRQRVAIARALTAEPEVLLCDEAVSALDVIVQAQVLELLAKVRIEHDLAMVFVSHDLGVVRQASDDVLVLKEGRVVEYGTADRVYGAPVSEYTRTLLADVPQALDVVGPVTA